MRNVLITFICVLICSCAATVPIPDKINGVSFVASRDEVAQEHIDPVVNVNADHAAVMPFGFIRDLESPELVYNTQRQWFGETSKGAKQYIEMLHKNNIQVMLKPQIWIWRGAFTGHLTMKTETEWQQLERSYAGFILEFAQLAQETNVAMYCIGTELNAFVSARPKFWSDLIIKVRDIYQGEITYAENWDTFANVPFWDELDYIGIDAYFPLSDEETPTLEALTKAWQPHKEEILKVHRKVDRPVLFTEYGYR
ncbi:MAG: glycoside hydrolase, partial [Flavobacteriaceae bacterium]|nr:glycoside hydrolase [Bacteroidia bacterium]NNL60168.1 glycoside hydrolase [Flavobacteriaceae bacterium]